MTDEELNVVNKSCELMNMFATLPEYHSADRRDVAFHVHAIQAIVMQREAVRAHPDVFRRESSKDDANKS